MSLRERLLEEFAGDLEYHPRRAFVYFLLAATAAALWIFAPANLKFTPTPLVFALGSLTLAAKGIFLLRKSSEGLGMSEDDHAALSFPSSHKSLPGLPMQAAQIAQDFGAGSLLLWPLLNVAKDIDGSWADPPLLAVFLSGAVLFALGWLIRRFTTIRSQ